MAVTRDEVLTAVEKYLPRTVNYARSADLGDKDTDDVFDRIRQIILTNLLVDPDTVFYIIYLAAQRLVDPINRVLAELDALMGSEQLKAITGEVPTRIEDLSKLTAARQSLVRLSTGLVTDQSFGDNALDDFKTDIEGFMSDQLAPNVADGGNRVQISQAIRLTMQALQDDWAEMLRRRDLVFTLLDKYTDEDLRTQVSAIIIEAVQNTLRNVEITLPNLSTEDQAAASEGYIVDIAAAEAALIVVGEAQDPVGTIIAGPASDGRTGGAYLVIEGTGQTEPVRPVLQGFDGELLLQGPTAGAPFTSTQGNTVAPGSGTLTDTVEDGGAVNYITEGIEEDMYLTFVDLGTSHVITAVAASTLTISPSLTHRPGEDLRYAITDHAPGRYFKDLNTTFWTEYATGTTAPTEIVDGTGDGEFVRKEKVSGSDGTNVAASGVGGTLRPRIASGTGGTIASGLSNLDDPAATFFTDLVEPGDVLVLTTGDPGTYSVSVVNSETDLDRVGTWGASSGTADWYIEDPNADDQFLFPGESLLILSLDANPILRIVSSPANGLFGVDFTIDGFLSQELGEVSPGTGVWTHDTAVSWEIINTGNARLYSSVDFLGAGVVAGDKVDIVGEGTGFEVTAVGQGYIDVTPGFSGPSFPAADFQVYTEVDGEVTDRFVQTSADFVALEINNTVTVTEYQNGSPVEVQVQPILRVDGVDSGIRSRDPASPTDTLIIAPISTGQGEFTGGAVFESADSTFLDDGIDITKHELVITSGSNAGTSFPIASVDSDTQITVTGTPTLAAGELFDILPKLASGLNWSIRAGDTTKHFFDTVDAPFTADSVGQIIVWKFETGEEVRVKIDTFISASEVWLSSPLEQDVTAPYAVIDIVLPGMELVAAGRRYVIKDIYSSDALDVDPKLSNAPGKGIDWHILLEGSGTFTTRILDPNLTPASIPGYPGGFPGASDGAGGFLTPNDFFNFRVDLMTDNPVRAIYVKGIDADGDLFAEGFQVDANLNLGRRNVAYKILRDFAGQSDVFTAEEVAPLPLENDILCVWGIEGPSTIVSAASATPDMELTLAQPLASGLLDQNYIVTRGGSQYYGKYALLDNFNSQLNMDEDTDLLRLKVAEVLIDFGEVVIPVDSGIDGEVANDGDDDGKADIFTSVSADFSAAKFGDRLTIGTEVTFVSAVLGDNTLRVDPPTSEGTGLTWTLERNSVSASLEEAEKLRTQAQELLDIINGYSIPRNSVIDSIVELILDQRLTRALDLLYDGEIDQFINLTAQDSSYAERARRSIQSVGAVSDSSDQLRRNVAGTNPVTGRPATRQVSATTTSTAPLNEDVDTRVAFAKAVSDIASDELMRGLAYATFEEQRNRAIYALSGEVVSGFVSDTDPTLPWIRGSGSIKARIEKRYQEARAAIQYMLDHPDEFCDPEPLEES
jgi:hypothetical protein